jgi:hypothetical protein
VDYFISLLTVSAAGALTYSPSAADPQSARTHLPFGDAMQYNTSRPLLAGIDS